MERSCPLSRFRPLIPVHAIFDLEFLSLFVLYQSCYWRIRSRCTANRSR